MAPFINKYIVWTRTNWLPFFFIAVIVLFACMPLYGVLFPPASDLSLHIMESKLLWGKLSGVSHLDLEISWYVGYRLSAYPIALLIGLCGLLGVPLLYVPKLVALGLVSLHAAVVGAISYSALSKKQWKSAAESICIS